MPRYTEKFRDQLDVWNKHQEDIRERYDRLLKFPGRNYKEELDLIDGLIKNNEPPKASFSFTALIRNVWNKLFGDKQGDPEYNDYLESHRLNNEWPEKRKEALSELTQKREEVEAVFQHNQKKADRNDERETHLKNREAVAEYKGFFDKLDKVQDRLRETMKGLFEKQDEILKDLEDKAMDYDERAMLATSLDTYKHNTASYVGAAIATGILYNQVNGEDALNPELKAFVQNASQEEIEEKVFGFSERMSEQFGNELLADRLFLFEEDENNRELFDKFMNGEISEHNLTEKFLGTLSDREKTILNTGKDPGPKPQPKPWETEEYDRVMREDENILDSLKEEDSVAFEEILDSEEFQNGELSANEIDGKFQMEGDEMKSVESLDF